MSQKIITRFAPSPTGFLHVGSLRTALYDYLFAKACKGQFFLRIEDTDQTRKVKGAVENLKGTLKQFGLNWDNKKPMVQSERLEIYQKAAEKLVKEDKAYYCFCSKERLDNLRKVQQQKGLPPMYDGHCCKLEEKKIKESLKIQKHVVRFKMPNTGTTEFNDLVRGKVTFDNKLMDDPIILKSDNWPTYHLASVIDDNEMNISHVIRGEEWLPSTPKHILLYQALRLKPPEFAHLPLLLNPDRSKLSKRQGDVTVEDFLKKGYLPEALLNFVLLLGWNPKTDQEIFSLDQMVKAFSLDKVNKAGAIFNIEKLDWLNGQYIHQMSITELTNRCISFLTEGGLISPIFKSEERVADLTGYFGQEIIQKIIVTNTKKEISFNSLEKIVATEQERIKKLDEIVEATEFFFKDPKYEPKLLLWKKLTPKEIKANLEILLKSLEGLSEEDWHHIETKHFKKTTHGHGYPGRLERFVLDLIKKNKIGIGDILWPMRVALTGRKNSPGPFEVAEALGKKESLKRIEKAINLLRKKG